MEKKRVFILGTSKIRQGQLTLCLSMSMFESLIFGNLQNNNLIKKKKKKKLSTLIFFFFFQTKI
jgi:hypothetical protein